MTIQRSRAAVPSESPRAASLALTAVLIATTVVMMTNTLLNAALPQLAATLRASTAQQSWMVDIYALTLAGFLIPAGALGDRYGRRKALTLGLVLMLVGNVVPLSWHEAEAVMIGRVLAGLGAAFAFPATLSTITTALPEEQRARGVTLWATVVGLAGFLGILVSGLLVSFFSPFSVFLFGVVAAAAALPLVLTFVPESVKPAHTRLDLAGLVLALIGIVGIMIAVTEGPGHGWSSAYVSLGLMVGVIGIIGFVLRELHHATPLLDVRVFRVPSMQSGCSAMLLAFFSFYGLFFLGIQYLLYVRGYGSLTAAVALLPVAIWFPVAPRVVPLVQKYGPRAVMTVGLVSTAVGYALLATLSTGTPYVVFAVALGVIGLSMVIVMPPATMAILGSVPQEQQGVASAVNDLGRQIGAAFGVALIGAVFNSRFGASLDRAGQAAPEQALRSLIHGDAPSPGVVQDAFMSGFRPAMVACAVALVVGAGITAWRTPRHHPRTETIE